MSGRNALGWLRHDLVRLLLLAIPALVVKELLIDFELAIEGSVLNPILVASALFFVVWLVWMRRQGDSPRSFGGAYPLFFLGYCLAFSAAADSKLLSGPRRLLASYEEATPRSFLALEGWGDWRYSFVPEAPPADDLIVVTLPSAAGMAREDVRRTLSFLIRQARQHESRGIAFDIYLAQPSAADTLLRREIELAQQEGLPVIFGYRHVLKDGLVVRQPLPPGLAEILPLQHLGHLAGYLEFDDHVRSIPLELPGIAGLASLSEKIAGALLAKDPSALQAPQRRLAKFTKPRGGVRVEAFSPELDWSLWRDRFILVGSSSSSDRHLTPFGELPGVVIHAYSAHSLRTGRTIHHSAVSWTFPAVFFLCYLLAVTNAYGVRGRWLVLSAAVLSLFVFSVAALVIRYGLVWIDISYLLVSIWFFVGLQMLGRWLTRRRARASKALVPVPEIDGVLTTSAAGAFDVFLSHNGEDKQALRQIAALLQARGLTPWLDEQELVPGRPWQEGLEEIISTVRSSAVFVGADGLGPWEIPEMRASLSECVRRGMPVIPVLLPGAGEQPLLPLFLTQYTWVDLRDGFTEEGLDRLEWGITGVKPLRA